MSLPNPGMDAVPFTPLTAEFLDDMIENIESLADGTGLDDGAVTAAKLVTGATGHGFLEIARTTLSVAGNTISLTGIPARNHLRLISWVGSTGGTTLMQIRFNSDSGNNYAVRYSVNGGADGTTVSGSNITPSQTAASDHYLVADILNFSAMDKRFNSFENEGAGGASTAPGRVEVIGKWVNTSSQITRIDITNTGTGNYTVGSGAIVLGMD